MKKSAAVIISIILAAAVEAQALFESTYWGVRSFGMGGAFTAVADDVNAVVYNIAGTAIVKKPEITFTSAQLISGLSEVDMRSNYAGAIYPISEKYGSVSAAWSHFRGDDLRWEDTINIGYARSLNDLGIWEKMDLSIGISGKYVRQKVDFGKAEEGGGKASRDGWTLDVGILAKLPYGISVGYSGRYMTRPDVGFKSEDKIPAMNVFGFAYYNEELPLLKIPKFTIAADYQMRSGDKAMWKFGAESIVLDGSLSLRMGGWKEMLTFGTGYILSLGEYKLALDYGFGLPLEVQETTGSHFLSLTLRFP